MIVANKSDLSFKGGYVIDDASNVVNNPKLVHQYNELLEVKEFNEFLHENEEKIKAVGTTVHYTPKTVASPLAVGAPETPAKDKKEAEALAIFKEVEAVGHTEVINKILDRNAALIAFVTDETVLITSEVTAEKFNGNPLTLTGDEIVAIAKDYVALEDLRNKVIVD